MEAELNCRERNRLVTDAKDDAYNTIEGSLGETVKMQCHFCDEPDDEHAKNWFKMDPLDDKFRYQVELDMETNTSLNRIHLNTQHTLTIRNLTQDDRGEYFCKGLEDDELNNKFNFLLDVVIPSDLSPEKGNLTHWKKYHDENISPINKMLNQSQSKEVLYLKNDLKVHIELETSWGRPSPCEICGRPKGDGRKYTDGHCRAKITRLGNPQLSKITADVKMLMRATHLSCRSISLHNLVPGIVNQTSYIPDYLLVEVCDGTCNPDAKGVHRGWRSTKKGFKYKKTFVLAENAHLTLICPESTLENEVEWKINNKLIRPGESKMPISRKVEAKVFVDSLNTLYLYGVTKDEEGNYTCYVDKVRMQQVRVFVVSKSKLLTQAFVRHMMYLAFVLSLTLSCYCAGLVITWTRRRKFKTYRQVRHELKATNKLIEDDLSSLTLSEDGSFTSSTNQPTDTTQTTPTSISPVSPRKHKNMSKRSKSDRTTDIESSV